MVEMVKGNPANHEAAPVENHTNNAASGQQKDAKEAATAPKFGDLLQQIQSKYGARPEKPKEIKKNLDKDDFLKIMISQMKNQDPTNPFKPEQMASELAQFTSVEQLHNVNQNLNKLSTQNKPLEQFAMTNIIGKWVTVDRERFAHIQGQSDPLSFALSKDAEQVKISIISEKGEVALEKELGAQKKGEIRFDWDGKNGSNLPSNNGNYMLRIEAKDDKGRALDTNSKLRSRVIGVSFEGSEPVFLVGDAQKQEKISVNNIIRVETDPAEEKNHSEKNQTAALGQPVMPPRDPAAKNLVEPAMQQGALIQPGAIIQTGVSPVSNNQPNLANLANSISPAVIAEKIAKGGEIR